MSGVLVAGGSIKHMDVRLAFIRELKEAKELFQEAEDAVGSEQ